MQTACALAGELLVGAPLDNSDVDLRQRQLARQHQPGRTASDNHHRMLGHRHTPALGSGSAILRDDPGLAASPLARYILIVARSGSAPCHLSSAMDEQPL